jgi:hypothetical protein
VELKDDSYFPQHLHVNVVRVNSETETIESNQLLNTSLRIWLEFGGAYYSHNSQFKHSDHYHDPDLDCGGKSFEEAVIKLALLVKNKYTFLTVGSQKMIEIQKEIERQCGS